MYEIEIVKVVLALSAAAFAYFRFFREGPHRQRIQFEIECSDLGLVGSERVVELCCIAENLGNVEQKFDDIRVTVRGIKLKANLCRI